MKLFRSTQRALAALTLAVLAGTGCQPTHTDYAAFIQEPRPVVSAIEYRIAPPDQIRVQSKRVREIDGFNSVVSPAGKVHLPLLGAIDVAGKTVDEVSDELRVLAASYYEEADVSVRVTSYASKKLFVFGHVNVPGPYPYTGTNTILGTLARAQPTRLADPTKIQILRPSADGDVRKKMTVNLDHMIMQGDTTLDAMLEEGDIIFVPPTPLASVGLGLQQLLLPLQPAASVVTGPGNIEEGATGKRSYGE